MLDVARALALVWMVSCAPRAEAPDAVPSPQAGAVEGVTGTVRVVGSAPVNVQIVLQPAEGGSIRLMGPLAEELGNLAGAQVTVFGEVGPAPDPLAARAVVATGYRIDSVDGEPVLSGEIVSITGGRATLRLADGEEVILDVPAGTFRTGQKVWVKGPRRVAVQSYGVIRP